MLNIRKIRISKIRPAAYKKMSAACTQHVAENYSFAGFQEKWVTLMDEIIERHGSWDTRKNYQRWHLLEVA